MSSPKKNVAYEFSVSLIDSADTGAFKVNPTIASGDFKVSTDNGALANLGTLPSVDPAGSIIVKITVAQAEMNGDKIIVQCIDAAGAEWDDLMIFIDATAANVDDVVRSTTPANTLDITAGGNAGIDWGNVANAATAVDLSATDIQLCDTVTANTDVAALNDLSAADVNAEVVDVLDTDTITLPGQEAPPLAPTHRQAIAWLYKVFRNRKTQTATQWSLLADDESTVDAKATVSDDATTAVKQEVVTGP